MANKTPWEIVELLRRGALDDLCLKTANFSLESIAIFSVRFVDLHGVFGREFEIGVFDLFVGVFVRAKFVGVLGL